MIKYFLLLTYILCIVCQMPHGNSFCASWCYRVLHKTGGHCQYDPQTGIGTCICH